jgi:hypothetical protein
MATCFISVFTVLLTDVGSLKASAAVPVVLLLVSVPLLSALVIFYTEDGGSRFLRTFGNVLPL